VLSSGEILAVIKNPHSVSLLALMRPLAAPTPPPQRRAALAWSVAFAQLYLDQTLALVWGHACVRALPAPPVPPVVRRLPSARVGPLPPSEQVGQALACLTPPDGPGRKRRLQYWSGGESSALI
jgi:hypothetical protein